MKKKDYWRVFILDKPVIQSVQILKKICGYFHWYFFVILSFFVFCLFYFCSNSTNSVVAGRGKKVVGGLKGGRSFFPTRFNGSGLWFRSEVSVIDVVIECDYNTNLNINQQNDKSIRNTEVHPSGYDYKWWRRVMMKQQSKSSSSTPTRRGRVGIEPDLTRLNETQDFYW